MIKPIPNVPVWIDRFLQVRQNLPDGLDVGSIHYIALSQIALTLS